MCLPLHRDLLEHAHSLLLNLLPLVVHRGALPQINAALSAHLPRNAEHAKAVPDIC